MPAAWAVDNHDPQLTARTHAQPAHEYRSAFQRDRDRVLHARAFRRLAGKTQVFTRRFSDHLRSRLTHTLEVTQLARTAAQALDLNEDLVETLALAHDIGHPPFGHAGERALDEALAPHGLAFDHNLHALRIVESFEQRYAAFPGLNLTLAVREGIVKHSRDYSAAEHPELAAYMLDQQAPLEAQLIDIVDEIGYTTADLDDGVEAGLLDIGQIREHVPLFERYYVTAAARYPDAWERLRFDEALKQVINAMVDDLITTTRANIRSANIQSLADVRHAGRRLVSLSPEMEAQRREAKSFLFRALYDNPELEEEKTLASDTVLGLFQRFTTQPETLPRHQLARAESDGLPRAAADYIAGMTDQFALDAWRQN